MPSGILLFAYIYAKLNALVGPLAIAGVSMPNIFYPFVIGSFYVAN